jgi:cytochrome c biogenesis protein CcdA
MAEFLLGCASALWLGVLTSVSPCPLATNVAAITYIAGRAGESRWVVLSGLLYTLGRMVVYVGVGAILTASLLSTPYLSQLLQRTMNKALGPILILVAMVLLNLIKLPMKGWAVSLKLQEKAAQMGALGALLLGILFALSFCPLSAALFFGSLIPLSVKLESSVVIPSIFGIGTGLPVAAFAFVAAWGARAAGKAFKAVGAVEKWARLVTGVVFLAIGIYFTLAYTFGLAT